MAGIPKVLSSRVVYRGRVFAIQVDELEMPDGVVTTREVLTHPGAVAMVPVTDAGKLLLVTQYRHAAGRRLLELPAGTLEPGEAPAVTAVRELQEEVGMLPSGVEPLGGFFVAPGYASEYIHLFVCTGLTASELAGDEDEDIEVVEMTVEEALGAIESGEICDAKSVVGILRWLRSANR
ncbi:MAG: NUDIX hydrolase [Tepidiformaceae bacterium]